MKTLREFLQDNKLRINDYKKIITGIDKSKDEMQTIDFDNVHYNGKRVGFTPVDKDQNFYYELSRFLIRMLRFVDVDDKKALNLAYTLFVISSRDVYKVSDLMEAIKAA